MGAAQSDGESVVYIALMAFSLAGAIGACDALGLLDSGWTVLLLFPAWWLIGLAAGCVYRFLRYGAPKIWG
jgi:hypothetical protein